MHGGVRRNVRVWVTGQNQTFFFSWRAGVPSTMVGTRYVDGTGPACMGHNPRALAATATNQLVGTLCQQGDHAGAAPASCIASAAAVMSLHSPRIQVLLQRTTVCRDPPGYRLLLQAVRWMFRT